MEVEASIVGCSVVWPTTNHLYEMRFIAQGWNANAVNTAVLGDVVLPTNEDGVMTWWGMCFVCKAFPIVIGVSGGRVV